MGIDADSVPGAGVLRSGAQIGEDVIHRFGDCELDTARFELRRAGRAQQMEPQVYRLLLHLVENRDRVVTRQELNDVVWNGRIVTEAALGSRIKDVRRAIGDSGKSQTRIRTVQRTGYRFVAPVSSDESEAARLGARAGDVSEVVSTADHLDGLELTLPIQPSVAVLPFRTVHGDPTHWEFADGLTHDITTRIAQARWLFVVARGSAFKFRSGPYDARDVGRALGVRYVVQGHVQISGNRISVHAVLSDCAESRERWAHGFHRKLNDICEMQDEIAETIVGSVESEIEHSERERAALQTPAGLDAWSAYHRGCWHMYRFAPADYDQAEYFFRLCSELDPQAARAYAGLSFIHWQRAFLELTSDRSAELDRALACAERCLTVDPREPLGHWALGRALLLRCDVDQAVDELELAAAANPSFAVGQYSLAFALMHRAESARSNEVVAKARRLSPYDPLTFAMFAVRAQNLAVVGNYAEAAALASRAARQPNAHYQVTAIGAYCSLLAGREQTAKDLYARVLSVRPTYTAKDFFRAFPMQNDTQIAVIDRTFRRLEALR